MNTIVNQPAELPRHSVQPVGSAKCPVCEMGIGDALFIHVYLEHPEVHDNIDKMLKGEPYESAETLRSKGILPNCDSTTAKR